LKEKEGKRMNSDASLWIKEKDWLVEVVAMDTKEDCAESLDYIGRLLAFAFVINTRVVAQVCNDNQRFPAYELWFSFTSEENKKAFLDFVHEDGYADPDEETTLKSPPTLGDLPLLRPLDTVFPKAAMDHILAVQLLTLAALNNAA
jgi:hypothetical protein